MSIFQRLQALFLALRPHRPAPRSLYVDWNLIQSMDGLPTDYLSLEERHAFDHCVEKGLAERVVIGSMGMHVFHRIHMTGLRPSETLATR